MAPTATCTTELADLEGKVVYSFGDISQRSEPTSPTLYSTSAFSLLKDNNINLPSWLLMLLLKALLLLPTLQVILRWFLYFWWDSP